MPHREGLEIERELEPLLVGRWAGGVAGGLESRDLLPRRATKEPARTLGRGARAGMSFEPDLLPRRGSHWMMMTSRARRPSERHCHVPFH